MNTFRPLPLAAAAAVIFGAVAVAQPAFAMDITNNESHAVQLKVMGREGAPTQILKLKPNEVIHSVCTRGCVIAMKNGKTTAFVGDENAVVQGGQISAG